MVGKAAVLDWQLVFAFTPRRMHFLRPVESAYEKAPFSTAIREFVRDFVANR